MLALFIHPFGILGKREVLASVHLFGGLQFYRCPLHLAGFSGGGLLSKAFLQEL